MHPHWRTSFADKAEAPADAPADEDNEISLSSKNTPRASFAATVDFGAGRFSNASSDHSDPAYSDDGCSDHVDWHSEGGASVASSQCTSKRTSRCTSRTGSKQSRRSWGSICSSSSVSRRMLRKITAAHIEEIENDQDVDATPLLGNRSTFKVSKGKRTFATRGDAQGVGRRTVIFDEPLDGETITKRRPKRVLNRTSSRQFAAIVNGEEGRLKTEESIFNSPIFGQSPDLFVKYLATVTHTRHYTEGQEICTRGTPGDSLFIFHSGTVSMTIGTDEEVAVLHSGDHFGEPNLFGLNTQWDATLTAMEQVKACELTREEFLNLQFQWPEQEAAYKAMLKSNALAAAHGTISHTCELFKGLDVKTLAQVDAVVVRRLYFPGQTILKQGSPSDSMAILVRGQCDVVVNEKVVRQEWRGSAVAPLGPAGPAKSVLMHRFSNESVAVPHDDGDEHHGDEEDEDEDEDEDEEENEGYDTPEEEPEDEEPICFGELGLLGIQKVRVATVVAHTICQVRVLYHDAFMKVLEARHDHMNMEFLTNFLKKRRHQEVAGSAPTHLQTLKNVSIFKEVGCSDQFLEFLSERLQDQIYLIGQRITDENSADDRCLFVLNQGHAKVYKAKQEVGEINAGAVFGEMVLLGLETKRSATIIPDEVCYAQVLHQSDVVHALKLFPEERQKVLMIVFQKGSSGLGPCKLKADGTPDWKANNLQAVTKAVQNTSTFGGIGAEFIEELSNVSVDRIFMPGDKIIEEGAHGDSLFIMVSGHAQVYVNQQIGGPATGDTRTSFMVENDDNPKATTTKIGQVLAGGVLGELAMLGIVATRAATVEAETICVLWEVSHEKAMPIIDAHDDIRLRFLDSVCKNLEHTVSNCIDSISLFSKFDRKFRMLLGLYCDRTAYFPGQLIFSERCIGEGLVILNLGQARLERKGIPIKTCFSGSHFNSSFMLGARTNFTKCFCTLVAVATCHIIVISRCSYVQALEQYPSENAAKELARTEQAASDEFREAIRKVTRGASGKQPHAAQATMSEAFTRLAPQVPNIDVMRNAFRKWWDFTVRNFRSRKQQKQRTQWTQDWIKKQREAVAHRASHKKLPDIAKTMPEAADQSWSLGGRQSPHEKVDKYQKLSGLYLGSSQEWQSMVFVPKSPRQQDFASQALSSGALWRSPRLAPVSGTHAMTVGQQASEGFGDTLWPSSLEPLRGRHYLDDIA